VLQLLRALERMDRVGWKTCPRLAPSTGAQFAPAHACSARETYIASIPGRPVCARPAKDTTHILVCRCNAFRPGVYGVRPS